MFADQPYKLELIRDLPENAQLSIYRHDGFVDLCRGPHVRSTSEVGPFKLLSVAGAYWRGSEKNPMLQRIYGTAWRTQKELDAYLHRLQEAEPLYRQALAIQQARGPKAAPTTQTIVRLAELLESRRADSGAAVRRARARLSATRQTVPARDTVA